jgi:hypothetical protein
MDWRQLWGICSAPDKVAIVGLIPLLTFTEIAETHHRKTWLAKALLGSYFWHCIGIPIVAFVLMIVHFWRGRKDGGISGPEEVVLTPEGNRAGTQGTLEGVA